MSNTLTRWLGNRLTYFIVVDVMPSSATDVVSNGRNALVATGSRSYSIEELSKLSTEKLQCH